MKLTLLEIVQDVLSDMESDEVNSINDSIEALQVAQIAKTTYFNIIDGREWPWLKELFSLTGLGDVGVPSHMQIPENIVDVSWIRYNCRLSTDDHDVYNKILYKTPEEFIAYVSTRNNSLSTIDTVTDFGGTILNILNNKAPTYYTSFDDGYIVFDSYDSAVDSTLQTIKTQCYGKRYPTFTMSDTFTADLPVQMFSYYLNEVKSTCFQTLKQMTHQKSEQHSITQRRRMSQEAFKTNQGITFPNYGRK